MTIKVTLHSVEGADEPQARLLRGAGEALERAVNHPDFRARVLAAPFEETLFSPPDGPRVSKTPEQVATIILDGLERGTTSDGEIDLAVAIDPSIKRNVVGITVVGKLPFRTARWFVDDCVAASDIVSPARHLMHEWLHVAGFVHRRQNGYRADVAYLVGGIVRSILLDAAFVGGMAEDAGVAATLDASFDIVEEESSPHGS